VAQARPRSEAPRARAQPLTRPGRIRPMQGLPVVAARRAAAQGTMRARCAAIPAGRSHPPAIARAYPRRHAGRWRSPRFPGLQATWEARWGRAANWPTSHRRPAAPGNSPRFQATEMRWRQVVEAVAPALGLAQNLPRRRASAPVAEALAGWLVEDYRRAFRGFQGSQGPAGAALAGPTLLRPDGANRATPLRSPIR
jgi:hypothetical protein